MTDSVAPLEGAWALQSYAMGQSPTATPIAGQLLFAGGRWGTVFFVDEGAAGLWGSGEGGEYVRDGDRLTFTHRLTFQGGAGKALVTNAANDRVEPCTITLDAGSLVILFPSGSRLYCRRFTA